MNDPALPRSKKRWPMREDQRKTSGVGPADEDLVVPLLEEELQVGKRTVETGRVRIRTLVETVEETARAVLQGERIEVERIPVDRIVDKPPSVRTEDGVTIIPVTEEIMIVEKRLLLKEEIHIRRRRTTEEVDVPVALRKQRAVVERVSPEEDNITQAESKR
jgi:uncharacterized protein (TIGR02271 family)